MIYIYIYKDDFLGNILQKRKYEDDENINENQISNKNNNNTISNIDYKTSTNDNKGIYIRIIIYNISY